MIRGGRKKVVENFFGEKVWELGTLYLQTPALPLSMAVKFREGDVNVPSVMSSITVHVCFTLFPRQTYTKFYNSDLEIS